MRLIFLILMVVFWECMVPPCKKCHNFCCRCVECLQCEGLFSPQKFVCHSHSPENRTCHWGFDSSNWLTYLQVDSLPRFLLVHTTHISEVWPSQLQLSEDYTKEERERHSKVMEDFKNRYQQQQQCPAQLRTAQGVQGAPGREGKRRQVRIHKLCQTRNVRPPSISDCWESQNSEAE